MIGRSILLSLAFVFATGWACPMVAEDEQPATPALDEALVEDLGAELLPPAELERESPLDQRLVEQLGEDVGQRPTAADEWRKQVVAPMQEAESHLQQLTDAASAGAAQQQALSGLDAMIAMLAERQSQCRGGQCDKPGASESGKKSGKAGKAGTSAATTASAAQSAEGPLTTAATAGAELVRDLWGHLPARQREQILQPLRDEFLPKYAAEIEAYFRALADPDSNQSAQP